MNIAKMIGLVLTSLPFIGLFAYTYKKEGMRGVFLVLGGVASLTIPIFVGLYLFLKK